jgi:hypothetical protein
MVMAGVGQSTVSLAGDGAVMQDGLIPLRSGEKSSTGSRSRANTWSISDRKTSNERHARTAAGILCMRQTPDSAATPE